MFKLYLKSAFRNLWNRKFYSFLNILGLAVGLATSIMLLMWVQNEWSFDKFHEQAENIYRINSHFKTETEENVWGTAPGPVKVYARDIPEIKKLVRINFASGVTISDKASERKFYNNKVAMADENFFDVFSFPFLYGNKEEAMADPYSVVLTRKTAEKIFKSDLEEIVGKQLISNGETFNIKGIIQDIPKNSTLQFDAVIPMSYYAAMFKAGGGNGQWKTIDTDVGNYTFSSFVELSNNASVSNAANKMSSKLKNAIGDNGDFNIFFSLQPLKDIHLISADGNSSSATQVNIIMLVVIMLLAIASINYINISTAQAIKRAKEVSVRKIIGANKHQLFLQFLLETTLLFAFAIILAMALIYLLMPVYNFIADNELAFSIFDSSVWKITGISFFATLIASSIYPALLLSSFKPIESLRGRIKSGVKSGTLRKGLVVLQFSMAIILLIATLFMSQQMEYMKNRDLGYSKENVVMVPLNSEARKHLDALKNTLNNNDAIENTAVTSVTDFSDIDGSTGDLDWPGKPKNSSIIITQVYAEKDFIPTMKIELLEGHNFFGTPADSSSFILNETAVRQMGLQKPYVGQEISFHSKKGKIIGVAKDFNFKHLREKVSPLILFSFWNIKNQLIVRTKAGQEDKAIAALASAFEKYPGEEPFSYSFIDDQFDTRYKADEQSETLFEVFAGIAIFISCLGLFGLSTYTAQTRKKEIGVRKVLGANVATIVSLLSKDFLKLVLIAIIIASPVAWWCMKEWLQGFAYRINLDWTFFLIAGFIAILIALFTVSFQAIKAAISNPAKSLRTE
ncbi:ABC transporter permease [Zunongwangia sp. F363]|uniref:ABC transporter permease n=1 Tax=Autumnicola tepida TaxID=3075595 RepID=A0ABU3CEX7_9FLAO|nr:ABC transporter permease [Zunongwangia sp. F363]MDT0644545.1 ABC transporter permease [Zunongwangia sp. F363]